MTRDLPKVLLRHRSAITTVANLAVIAVAYAGAYLLRFDFALPAAYRHQLLVTVPVAVAIHFAAFYAFKLTRGWWRYVGVADFINAVKAAFVGALGLGAYVLVFERGSFFPRSVLFVNMVLVVGLSMGMRLGVRIWRQMPLDRGNGER